MSANKNYWIPLDYKDSFIRLSRLKYDEIAVLVQIMNLIYINEGALNNDPLFIARNCGMRPSKYTKVINSLILKGEVYINEEGKICEEKSISEIKDVQKKREQYSEVGKKGAEKRWGNKQNQEDSYAPAILGSIANTNTNKNHTYKTKTIGEVARQEEVLSMFGRKTGTASDHSQDFDIEPHLSSQTKERVYREAPDWELRDLIRKYNKWHVENAMAMPDNPEGAFIGWARSFVKAARTNQ